MSPYYGGPGPVLHPPRTLWEAGIDVQGWRLFIRVSRWGYPAWGCFRKWNATWGWNIDLGTWRIAGGLA